MDVTFRVPPAFQEITPGLAYESARNEFLQRTKRHQGSQLDHRLDQMATLYHRVSAFLGDMGVFYSASCVGRINDELSAGTLTMAMRPLAYSDTHLAAAGIARIMAEHRGGAAAVEVLELPCGEAALVFEQTPTLRIPAKLTADGEDIPIDVAQMQAFIPIPEEAVPGAQELLTVTFSTPSTDHWEEYCDILVALVLLRSLRFSPEAPGTASEPQESLGPDATVDRAAARVSG